MLRPNPPTKFKLQLQQHIHSTRITTMTDSLSKVFSKALFLPLDIAEAVSPKKWPRFRLLPGQILCGETQVFGHGEPQRRQNE